MSLTRRPMRYAHSEGHTDLCYTEDGKQLITCGNDGDIRTWSGLDDDEPESYCVGEGAFSVLQKGKFIYVCTDDSKVSILKYPEGERDGLLTRFTAPATHIATTKAHPILACVSEDFTVKVLSLEPGVSPMTFTDAKGPALAVAISPNAKTVAVSSGDGKMYIWNLDEQKLIKTIDCVPYTNSFTSTKLLCRMSFNNNGKLLAYPHHKEITIVSTDQFQNVLTLSASVTESFSIVQFSPCGKYLAASTANGDICIWHVQTQNLIGTTNHPQKLNVCSLAWNPTSVGEIAFCDVNGQLGTLENCCVQTAPDPDDIAADVPIDFDDSDNENAVSLERLKNDTLRPQSVGSGNILGSDAGSRPMSPVRPSSPPNTLQAPFQPGSTPAHLTSRFMCYNDIGIVQQYNDEDPSIDIYFHDVTLCKNIYMKNHLGHTMASLSATVLALACETPSKLVCIPLKPGVKEWTCEMSDIEEILCVTASVSLVAVATDARFLRVFSIYGTQRAVLSLPGPIVTLSSRNNALVAVYHANTSYSKDQNLAAMLIQFKGTELFSKTLTFPVTPESLLSWVGFTDAGSIASYDNTGVLRLFKISSGIWIPACNTSTHAKGASDFYFLTHVREASQILQVIHCRGAMYPVTVPPPILMELPMCVMMCELGTDKGQFEERMFRWSQLLVDQSEKTIQENALKLFALACRSELDDRALELLEILADRSLTSVGVRYANKMNRPRLVEKLKALLQDINDEDEENDENVIPSFKPTPRVNRGTLLNSQGSSQNVLTPEATSTPIEDIKKNESSIPSPSIASGFLKKNKAGLRNPLKLSSKFPDKVEFEPVPSTSKSDPPLRPKETNIEPKKAEAVNGSGKGEETFMSWFEKEKDQIKEKFPNMSPAQITQYALQMYKIYVGKRKAGEETQNGQKAKQPKLSAFAFNKS